MRRLLSLLATFETMDHENFQEIKRVFKMKLKNIAEHLEQIEKYFIGKN